MSGNEERLLEAFVEGLDRSRGLAAERDAAAFVAKLNGIIGGGGTEAVWKNADSGVGNSQLKSWGRWAIGVGVLTTCLLAIAIGGRARTHATPIPKTFSTLPGQRATITLPDNSTVILAPQSSISYASDFGANASRTVKLNGQALFTVGHASGKPFVVQAGEVSTRVLGTSFSVRRYAGDTAVRVIIAQGRVAIGSSVLGTGDVAVAQNDNQVVVSRGNALAEELAWAEGRLVFRGTLLSEVIPELERWYGITITVTDKALLNLPVITTLDTETPARALELVALSLEARAELSGNRAVIHLR